MCKFDIINTRKKHSLNCTDHNCPNDEIVIDNIENDNIENDVIENNVIENDVIENDVIENDVIENDVIENDVIENDVIDESISKNIVTAATTIHCKFRSILNQNTEHINDLQTIFKDRVFHANPLLFNGIALFNVYILYLCENKISTILTQTTLHRCTRSFLTDKVVARKTGKNKEELVHINFLKKEHFESIKDPLNNEDAIMKPLEVGCNIYFTNLKQHITSNFLIYQKRYLEIKFNNVQNKLTDKMSISNRKFILYALQQCINGDTTYTYEQQERKEKLKQLFEKYKTSIDSFIFEESTILKSFINFTKKLPINVSETTIIKYIHYLHSILQIIIDNKGQRFSLFPHYQPKNRHIHFDQRPLCAIYNKWKKINNTEWQSVGTKKFEKSYYDYIDEMFNIRTKFAKIVKKYPHIRSISTDGYVVSLTFTQLTEIKYTEKEKGNVEDLIIGTDKKILKKKETPPKMSLEIEYNKCFENGKQIKPTIFDALNIESSNEYLDKFNKSGCDIGVDSLMVIVTEAGKTTQYTRNEHNDRICKKQNDNMLKKIQKYHKIEDIYSELSTTCVKTTKISEYIEYTKIIKDNWYQVWNYCFDELIPNLKFSIYRNKQQEIKRASDKIIKEIKEKTNIKTSQKKYFNEEQYEQNKEKPILIAIGTGNGNITVNNVKGSAPKGPIQKLINELGKKCLVILTPEQYTSQICNLCECKLEDIETYKYPSKSKIEKDIEKKISECEKNGIYKQNKKETQEEYEKKKMEIYEKERKIIEMDIEYIKIKTQQIHSQKKEDRKKYNENKEEKEEEKRPKYYVKSYKIRQCANTHTQTNGGIIWQRDINAAKNIEKMMRTLITTGMYGCFKKQPKSIPKNKMKPQKQIGGDRNIKLVTVAFKKTENL
jgi:hypothetical protein